MKWLLRNIYNWINLKNLPVLGGLDVAGLLSSVSATDNIKDGGCCWGIGDFVGDGAIFIYRNLKLKKYIYINLNWFKYIIFCFRIRISN